MDDQTTAPIAAPESAPSTDSAPVTPSDRLARMSPAETAEWRQSGTVPGTEAPVSAHGDGDGGDVVEDHSAEPPASSAAPVAVDPAASAAGKALNRQKQTAQQRINDLARDKYRLEGELKSLRDSLSSRSAAAAEVPPVAPPSAPASRADGDAPQEEDFASYRDFVDARADYRIRLAQQADRAERAQQQGRQQLSDVAKAHDTRVEAFAAAHPDYLDVITQQTAVMPTPLLAEAVLHSELAPEIAYHLNTHLDEYRALLALAPGPLLKALGKLEARLEAAAPASAAATTAASTPQHVTRAPAPPVTLGSRPAEPADDVERAGARRDVGAYIRTMNAREAAARR